MSDSQINFSLGNHDFMHMIRIHLLKTTEECKGSRRKYSFIVPVSYLSQGLKSSSFLEMYLFWLAGAEVRACMSCRQWQQPMECISLSVNKLPVLCRGRMWPRTCRDWKTAFGYIVPHMPLPPLAFCKGSFCSTFLNKIYSFSWNCKPMCFIPSP